MMKPEHLRNCTVSLMILGSFFLGIKPSITQPAPGQRGFYCDTNSATPSTVYQNAQGGREVWIKWVSDAFADYDPLTRCQQVSGRFETYRRNKQLRYITVGRMNGQNVICTASVFNGMCEGLLYTLKPGQDPIDTLYNLLAWREGKAGVSSLSESGSAYIDVSNRIEYDTETTTPANVPTTNIQQVAPQQVAPQPVTPSNGSREL